MMLLMPMLAWADDSGSCGANVNYTYTESTKTLVISGTGEMDDYTSYSLYSTTAPWNSYKDIIQTVIIENGVTHVGGYAFCLCYALTSVTLPNSVTSIGYASFYNCSALTSLPLPNNMTTIGGFSLWGCSGLTSLTIPASVTTIDECAFYGCKGLTSLTIPASVTAIGDVAFSGCGRLTTISVESGNPKYDSRNNCNAIIETESNTLLFGCRNTVIPTTVTSVEEEAFHSCIGLTTVNIPNSVTSIGEAAFYDCQAVTSMILGSGIQVIGEYGLGCSPDLADVYCYAVNVPDTPTKTFYASDISKATLHVPAASIDAYKAADPWMYFGTIVALTDSDPKPTAIHEIRAGAGKATYYDLNGRRLSAPRKDINIINGKTVIIR